MQAFDIICLLWLFLFLFIMIRIHNVFLVTLNFLQNAKYHAFSTMKERMSCLYMLFKLQTVIGISEHMPKTVCNCFNMILQPY